MDTDSLSSAPVFLAFLLLFSYLSLVEHSAYSGATLATDGWRAQRAGPLLRWSKYACVIAVALSGLALAHSINSMGWWPVSFLSLGLLIALAAIDRVLGYAASRYPAWAAGWSRPLARIFAGRLGTTPHFADSNGPGGNGFDEAPGEWHPDTEEPAITQAELISLDQRDREMLRSILRLDVTIAREVMVPRLDMNAVEVSSTLVQVAEMMIQGGHSRLPVYDDTIDHVLGIVHSREVLASLAHPEAPESLRDLIRPAFIIPETKRLDELLEELKDKGVQMAIVVDEYGGTEGLVTMEDLLEEIVGEIEDEFSRTREAEVVQLPDGGVLVDAGVATEDVEELFTTSIDSTDVDTVGGYVYLTLGKIPQAGDVVFTDHLRIEVVSILGRRIRKLRISRIEEGADAT